MERKKVLFFIQNGVGGAERMTINIAKLLSPEEYEVIFCKVTIPCIFQNGRIEDFIPKGNKIINISWSGQISFIKQIYKVLKFVKPDIVFSSLMHYNQRILFLKRWFPGIKFIVRNDNYLFTIGKLKRFSLSKTYKNADVIIAQTEEMKEEFIQVGLNPDKIVVLHNLLDTDLISKKAEADSPFPPDGKPRFIAVGRLDPQKGFDILIDAFSILSKSIPDAELYIIGTTEGVAYPYYLKLTEQIKKLGLEDKIIFTGYTDNPYKYIKNGDVYVLSSRYEGLPNVLIEALFLNKPAAAAKCIPIISRMVKDGENGYLAESENPESLAQAMMSALNIKEVKQIYHPSTPQEFVQIFK